MSTGTDRITVMVLPFTVYITVFSCLGHRNKMVSMVTQPDLFLGINLKLLTATSIVHIFRDESYLLSTSVNYVYKKKEKKNSSLTYPIFWSIK